MNEQLHQPERERAFALPLLSSWTHARVENSHRGHLLASMSYRVSV